MGAGGGGGGVGGALGDASTRRAGRADIEELEPGEEFKGEHNNALRYKLKHTSTHDVNDHQPSPRGQYVSTGTESTTDICLYRSCCVVVSI